MVRYGSAFSGNIVPDSTGIVTGADRKRFGQSFWGCRITPRQSRLYFVEKEMQKWTNPCAHRHLLGLDASDIAAFDIEYAHPYVSGQSGKCPITRKFHLA
jgi:hypothetical protein